MCIRTPNTGNFSESILTVDSTVGNCQKEMEDITENNHASKKEEIDHPSHELDTLATLTARQRKLAHITNEKIENFHHSSFYRILFGTTQPAHVVSVITISIVMSLFYKSTSFATSKNNSPDSFSPPSTTTTIIYLVAFCAHFGSQFWMTFVSGLSLYFSLPRHAFGNVQKVLFPKYFSLNAFLSAVTLVAFNQLNHPRSNQRIFQEFTLIINFLLELTVRLYAVPPLLKLISAKTAIEAKVGVGQEVGYHDAGPLKNCPHYKELHKMFRRIHLCVAIGNIFALICTTLHLQYLAYHLTSLTNCYQNHCTNV